MTGWSAVIVAALAGWLIAGGRTDLVRRRLHPPDPARRGGPDRSVRRGWRGRLPARFGRPAQRTQPRHADAAAACLALSAELSSGVPPGSALAAVAREWPDLFGNTADEASIGGDVPSALRARAASPGCAALRAVAAGWEVTERTGAPLARTLVAVADTLRSEDTVRKEAASQLATARTTGRLLAVLPVATVLLLSGPDGAALQFLVTTPPGLLCLFGAAVLGAAGLWWVNRLARSATGSIWMR